jgi:4-amino-4-deoxy-L-arabinose transferase-like glycosyltransferase
VREVQPIAARAPWPGRASSFLPMGHVPAPGPEGTIVPMCAAVYPLIRAAAKLAAGREAMFWVVPLMGGLAVWLTFAIGRHVAGPSAGLLASLLLATSPTFLYQVVQPMTDVPAAALWALALAAAWWARGSGLGRAAAAGLATGAALMVRPNLLPLAFVTGGMVCFVRPLSVHSILRAGIAFDAGLLPFVVAIAAIQHAMYGGPLRSGYGDLD